MVFHPDDGLSVALSTPASTFNPNAAKLTTTGKVGPLEEEQPKVGPKGEGVGTSESKDAESTDGE